MVADGEIVVVELSHVVKIGDSGDGDLFGLDPFANEVFRVSFRCNTEEVVGVGKSVRGGVCQVTRKPKPPHQFVNKPFRLGDPLLNKDNLFIADILLNDQVAASKNEIVFISFAPHIDLELFLCEVGMGFVPMPAAQDRKI